MLEIINALACAILFGYCFIVAGLMPGGLRMGAHKLVMLGVTLTLGAQVLAPFSDLVEVREWPAVVLHVLLAAALIIWRAEAMHFVRCKFVPPQPGVTHRRRRTDWGDLAGPQPVSDEQLRRVIGGAG